jgi:6-phosphogluconolactonase
MRCPGRTGSETSGGAPDSRLAHEAADEYERLLRAHGSAMDLVLLGLGEDGHTASLFPGSRTLDEKGRWAAPVFREANGSAGGAGTEPFWRVTLTPSFINQAKAVFFLASGTAKAAISRRVIDGGTGTERLPTHRLPAQLIRPADGVLCWFLDEDAASQLSEHGGA